MSEGGGGGVASWGGPGPVAPSDLTPDGLAAWLAPYVSAALRADRARLRALVASFPAGPLVRALELAAFDRAFPRITDPAFLRLVARRVIEVAVGAFGPALAPYTGPVLGMLAHLPGFEPGSEPRAYVDALAALLATRTYSLPAPVRYGLANPTPGDTEAAYRAVMDDIDPDGPAPAVPDPEPPGR